MIREKEKERLDTRECVKRGEQKGRSRVIGKKWKLATVRVTLSIILSHEGYGGY